MIKEGFIALTTRDGEEFLTSFGMTGALLFCVGGDG